jgi:K+/H+ antiporter YhaU regulatory subunit KhtT
LRIAALIFNFIIWVESAIFSRKRIISRIIDDDNRTHMRASERESQSWALELSTQRDDRRRKLSTTANRELSKRNVNFRMKWPITNSQGQHLQRAERESYEMCNALHCILLSLSSLCITAHTKCLCCRTKKEEEERDLNFIMHVDTFQAERYERSEQATNVYHNFPEKRKKR